MTRRGTHSSGSPRTSNYCSRILGFLCLVVFFSLSVFGQISSQSNAYAEYCVPDSSASSAYRPLLDNPVSSRAFVQRGGIQWTTPVVIDTSTPNVTTQLASVIAVDDSGNLAVAMTEGFTGGGWQIVIERSTNKGQTWVRSVPFGWAYGTESQDIAFDRQGNVWLLWSSMAGQFDPIYIHLSKSTDNGQTFSTLFTSREYAAPFFEPKVAIDKSSNVFLLWDDQQFKLTRFATGIQINALTRRFRMTHSKWGSFALSRLGPTMMCTVLGLEPESWAQAKTDSMLSVPPPGIRGGALL